MATLCCSSLNVWRNGVVLAPNEQQVGLYAYLNLKVSLALDAVWCHNLILMLRCVKQWRWWLCVYLRWMYETGSCWRPERIVCTFVGVSYFYMCVCLNLEVILVFGVVWGRNVTLMCCFLYKYNDCDGNGRSALIFVGQTGSTFVLLSVCMCDWIWRWYYWCSM